MDVALEFYILKHSHEINFPACSVMLCISLKIIGFSSVLVEINKTPNSSKKDESTNNNTLLKEEVAAEINKHETIQRKMNQLTTMTCCNKKLLVLIRNAMQFLKKMHHHVKVNYATRMVCKFQHVQSAHMK